MSLAFSLRATPFREIQHMNMNRNLMATNSSSFTVKCSRHSHTTSTNLNLIGKIKDKCNNLKVGDKSGVAPATSTFPAIDDINDIPSNLCLIDTLQRLGVARYFRSEIDTILHHTYKLWQRKDREIFTDIATHAMAFRLLRVKGFQVSSEELAPYAYHDCVTAIDDAATVLELYRASQERMYEEETTLEKLHTWTSTFLKQQLLTNSIPDIKLHKQVEFYLRNYYGILERVEVRRNLELYDDHYQAADHRFSADLVAFARQNFNICQAQNQKELEQLQRWYAYCRLDTQKFGRDVVRTAHFLASALFGDPQMSEARHVFVKHVVLAAHMDDFFDDRASREEAFEILELVKEWKEKPSSEYISEEVEVLFTAVYNTLNELAEKAHILQGRSVKDFLIKLWVEILSAFKTELDVWSDDTTQSLDEYISVGSYTIAVKICTVMALPFLGIKLSDEMLESEEFAGLCRHGSVICRLLNDVQTNEKERKEKTKNSVGIVVAEGEKDRVVVSEEEASAKIKEIVEQSRRRLMQIVYKRDTIFPTTLKDLFMSVGGSGYYLYSATDQFTSPQQQMMEDMKSLLNYITSLNYTQTISFLMKYLLIFGSSVLVDLFSCLTS